MPAKISDETRGKIVQMRALDYTKQEIADELNISRNTVSKHLKEVQNEAEESDDPESVVFGALLAGIGFGAGIAIAEQLFGDDQDQDPSSSIK